MGPTKAKKPARITTACNACRSRKQKCSGQKPICGQCLDYKRPCNWPEQLRRGPEKGYAEALENRLQLTESLLLNLLPHVSNEQLSLAIPRQAVNHNCDMEYVPFPRLEKRGMESWSQFPLDSSHGVRKWQQACVDGDVALRAPSPKKRRVSPPTHSASITPPQEPLRIGESFTATRYLRTPGVSTSMIEHTTEESPSTARTSTWDAAPPLEFQRQFLW